MADAKPKVNTRIEDPERQVVIAQSDGNDGRLPNDMQRTDKIFTLAGKEEPSSKHWRGVVGTYIATKLGWTDGSDGKAWHLFDWPKGYSLWIVAKTDGTRKDIYLYGGRTKYSSPIEFRPHAYYLYMGMTVPCRCWVCTGRKRGDVRDDRMNTTGFMADVGSSPEKPRRQRAASPPDLSSSLPGNETAVNTTSNSSTADESDLIQVIRIDSSASVIPRHEKDPPIQSFSRFRENDLRSGRRFRFGELVWVSIPPLVDPEKEEAAIHFWPGLIKEYWTHKESTLAAESSSNGSRYVTKEFVMYRVMLLGVMHVNSVDERLIIPYQAYAIRRAVQQRLRTFKLLNNQYPRPHRFFPIPAPSSIPIDRYNERTYAEAIFPLKLANRIAEKVQGKWAPTNKWNPDFSDQEVGEPDPGRARGSRSYQGLWWGPERIWVGDLVRLTFMWGALDSSGLSKDLLPPSPGADTRGLLLRISSIVLDRRLARFYVTGPMYEVAEARFMEDQMQLDDEAVQDFVNVSLSSPASVYKRHYTMPEPPNQYAFKRITRPGTEVSLPLQYIAGRYDHATVYADVMQRFFNKEKVQNYQGDMANESDADITRLMSIHSLLAGELNAIVCEACLETRQLMLERADSEAREELKGPQNVPNNGSNVQD
ncbi:hypothetical protein FRC02_005199 [Tulasnella sp. 418]|nr:hypothetical protein FRC02_005199 [Tulasnella sp. 418]